MSATSMSARTIALGSPARVGARRGARAVARCRATTSTGTVGRSSATCRATRSRAPLGVVSRAGTVVARAGDDLPGPLDGLDASPVKVASADDDGDELLEVENVPPTQFLLTSCAFYVIMGVGSQAAASFLGVHPDVLDAMGAVNLDQASLWSLPLLASLAFAITQADKYEFLGEVRDIFKTGILPSLAPLGLPGILALSLGAGVGEGLSSAGFSCPSRTDSSPTSASPRASPPWASWAPSPSFSAPSTPSPRGISTGPPARALLFGVEYVQDGLGTAAVTHTLYDFLAFGFILVSWPIEGYERELPFGRRWGDDERDARE